MKKGEIAKLLLSAALFLVAASGLVLALKHSPAAHAATGAGDYSFTLSHTDGKALYALVANTSTGESRVYFCDMSVRGNPWEVWQEQLPKNPLK